MRDCTCILNQFWYLLLKYEPLQKVNKSKIQAMETKFLRGKGKK
jgi:hypothetical protein